MVKNKEYVAKYADRLMGPEANKAAVELMDDFVREYNAVVRSKKITKDAEAEKLVRDLDRKGDELAGMLMVKCGRRILKQGWFGRMAAMIREAEADGGKDDKAEVH